MSIEKIKKMLEEISERHNEIEKKYYKEEVRKFLEIGRNNLIMDFLEALENDKENA